MNTNTQQNPSLNTPGSTQKINGCRVSASPTQPDKLIRIKTVCELTGMGKSSVYSIPDFPKRVVLSRRAVGWRLSEVMQWIETRTAVAGVDKEPSAIGQQAACVYVGGVLSHRIGA